MSESSSAATTGELPELDEWSALLMSDEGSTQPPTVVALPTPRRSAGPTLRRLLSAPAELPVPSVSWLEIRLFYVRISPCSVDTTPSHLILTHLRRETSAAIEINGERIPAHEPTFISLRRDRADRDASEVIYVSTIGVRVMGMVDFEVFGERGNRVLCGSLERMETPWFVGNGFSQQQNSSEMASRGGWSMYCYLPTSIGTSPFLPPIRRTSSIAIEVYLAGRFASLPVIFVQTLQFEPTKKAVKPGTLDSIPEDEDSTSQGEEDNNSLVLQRAARLSASEEGTDDYDSGIRDRHVYYIERGRYSDEDWRMTWFNAGVRVGIGLGLCICVGLGVGLGLFNRNLSRRFSG